MVNLDTYPNMQIDCCGTIREIENRPFWGPARMRHAGRGAARSHGQHPSDGNTKKLLKIYNKFTKHIAKYSQTYANIYKIYKIYTKYQAAAARPGREPRVPVHVFVCICIYLDVFKHICFWHFLVISFVYFSSCHR